MKRIISLLIIISCITECIHAQIGIIVNLKQFGKFNDKTIQYDSSFTDIQKPSRFEFDRDFTILTHEEDSKKSTYLIKSQKKDEVNNRWEFDIISDTGHSYYMIIDNTNKNIRFIYRVKGSTYVTQFDIKMISVKKQDTNN